MTVDEAAMAAFHAAPRLPALFVWQGTAFVVWAELDPAGGPNVVNFAEFGWADLEIATLRVHSKDAHQERGAVYQ